MPPSHDTGRQATSAWAQVQASPESGSPALRPKRHLEPVDRRVDTRPVKERANVAARLTAAFGASSVRRDAETWPRRDSFLLTGLLALVLYLLVAVVVFARFSLVADLLILVWVALIGAYALAEGLYAIRPTPTRLVHADHLALAAGGTWLCTGLIVTAAWAASLVLG